MPELNFKGKEYVYNHHMTVPYAPLVPDADKSVGAADMAGNLIIHGDNLHALKALLPTHAGEVDLIFIDPPYNTGNEGWSYNDNVNSPIMREWLTNNPVDGDDMLRHDKWLCMMWPRLVLLRELLSERGTFWMTIDDHEVHRARAALDEVFGEEKFVACNVWQKRYSRENREAIGDVHDYVLVYANQPEIFKALRNRVPPTEDQLTVYRNPNEDPRGRWRPIPMTAQGQRPNQMYTVTTPSGAEHRPPEGRCWSMLESEYLRLREQGRIWFGIDGSSQPNVIRYVDEVDGFVPWTWWPAEEVGHTDGAKKEVYELLGRSSDFDTPKPLGLLNRIVQIATRPDYVVLDSFAGSGTTAHAVLAANAADGGNRRFILVESEDYAERITAERVRRAINGYAFSGTKSETLLEKALTWSEFKKADATLAEVQRIKVREGLADGDLADRAERRDKPRFSEIRTTVKDGVLRVQGVKRVSERMDGLGGEFTYCTLGDALRVDALLRGEQLPDYDTLGAWLYHTATGAARPKARKTDPQWYLGPAQDKHLWLVYKPDLAFLKSPDAALTLSLAERLQTWSREHGDGKPNLVLAPAKYLSNKQLLAHGCEYAPLPFALFREV